MQLEDLSRSQKVILWCLHYLNELKAKGLVDGGFQATPKGTSITDQLLASGFRPTDEEWQRCVRFLTRDTV